MSSVVANGAMIEGALTQLSADHRQVIELREIEELSYEDIAARLGVPVGTVRSRLLRARQQLAQLLVASLVDR